MNKTISFLCMAAFLTSLQASATIRRVNNNTGVLTAPAAPNTIPVYTTAQAAHDASSNGDTIHIEPSGIAYGNITILKRVIIVGNGYFLGPLTSNFNPGLQALTGSSILGQVSFGAGSDNAEMMGCTITGATYIGYNPSVGIQATNNIIFKRNSAATINLYTTNNSQIIQNYINGFVNGDASYATQNFNISNNIIFYGVDMNLNDQGIFQHNISSILGGYSFNVYNSIVRNNIVVAAPGALNATGSTVENNMSNGTLFGVLNGNQNSVTMTNVFEDLNNASPTFTEDNRFRLKAASPAIATGFGSADMGAFGGSFPYIVSGIPNVPTIYRLTVNATVTSTTMPVIISTRSNN